MKTDLIKQHTPIFLAAILLGSAQNTMAAQSVCKDGEELDICAERVSFVVASKEYGQLTEATKKKVNEYVAKSIQDHLSQGYKGEFRTLDGVNDIATIIASGKAYQAELKERLKNYQVAEIEEFAKDWINKECNSNEDCKKSVGELTTALNKLKKFGGDVDLAEAAKENMAKAVGSLRKLKEQIKEKGSFSSEKERAESLSREVKRSTADVASALMLVRGLSSDPALQSNIDGALRLTSGVTKLAEAYALAHTAGGGLASANLALSAFGDFGLAGGDKGQTSGYTEILKEMQQQFRLVNIKLDALIDMGQLTLAKLDYLTSSVDELLRQTEDLKGTIEHLSSQIDKLKNSFDQAKIRKCIHQLQSGTIYKLKEATVSECASLATVAVMEDKITGCDGSFTGNYEDDWHKLNWVFKDRITTMPEKRERGRFMCHADYEVWASSVGWLVQLNNKTITFERVNAKPEMLIDINWLLDVGAKFTSLMMPSGDTVKNAFGAAINDYQSAASVMYSFESDFFDMKVKKNKEKDKKLVKEIQNPRQVAETMLYDKFATLPQKVPRNVHFGDCGGSLDFDDFTKITSRQIHDIRTDSSYNATQFTETRYLSYQELQSLLGGEYAAMLFTANGKTKTDSSDPHDGRGFPVVCVSLTVKPSVPSSRPSTKQTSLPLNFDGNVTYQVYRGGRPFGDAVIMSYGTSVVYEKDFVFDGDSPRYTADSFPISKGALWTILRNALDQNFNTTRLQPALLASIRTQFQKDYVAIVDEHLLDKDIYRDLHSEFISYLVRDRKAQYVEALTKLAEARGKALFIARRFFDSDRGAASATVEKLLPEPKQYHDVMGCAPNVKPCPALAVEKTQQMRWFPKVDLTAFVTESKEWTPVTSDRTLSPRTLYLVRELEKLCVNIVAAKDTTNSGSQYLQKFIADCEQSAWPNGRIYN